MYFRIYYNYHIAEAISHKREGAEINHTRWQDDTDYRETTSDNIIYIPLH